MKIWPTISRTTLKACNDGAIVRVAGSHFPNLLAIVCKDKDGGKGLIFLGERTASFRPVERPAQVEVFPYGGDPVLLLDHANSYPSDKDEISRKMGLVVFVKSDWYLNVHHVTDLERPHLQFNLEHNTVDRAYKNDSEDGVVFNNWKLALVNSHIPHAKPTKIFTMQL